MEKLMHEIDHFLLPKFVTFITHNPEMRHHGECCHLDSSNSTIGENLYMSRDFFMFGRHALSRSHTHTHRNSQVQASLLYLKPLFN